MENQNTAASDKIKSTDLRIGNTLMKNGIVVTIDSTSILDIDCYPERAAMYSPIPLTEEWLKRFGFEQEIRDSFTNEVITKEELSALGQVDYAYIKDGIYIRCIEHPSANHGNKIFKLMKVGDKIIFIHFVNQLQNIFHSLTGQELK
jgi:hypothetical protein